MLLHGRNLGDGGLYQLAWVINDVLDPDAEEYFPDAHPEAAQNLAHNDVVEESLFAAEHLVEDIEQLQLGAEPNLGDGILVLALDKGLEELLDLLQLLCKLLSLHIDVEHLLAQNLLIFHKVGKLQEISVDYLHSLLSIKLGNAVCICILCQIPLSLMVETEYLCEV